MSTKITPSSYVSGTRNRSEFFYSNFCRPLLAGVLAIALVPTADAASETWVGNTSNATSGTNWSPTSTTTSGDSWAFGTAGSAGAALTNDLTAGFSVAGITFNSGASAFTIGGNQITLSANITNSSTALQTINFDITGTGNRTFSSTNGGGNIVLGGVIGGSQNVTITSAYVAGVAPNGTVTLSGSNTYNGTTTLTGGVLVLNNNNALGNSTGVALSATNNNVGSSTYLKIGSGVTITGKTLTQGGQTGTTATSTLQADTSGVSTWDGNMTLTKGLTLNATLGGDLVIGAVGAGRTILGTGGGVTNVGGNTTINSDITGNASIAISAGRLSLNSTSSSTNGTVSITGGTLAVVKLADAGSNSSVGAGTGAISMNQGTLQYIGTGDTSNRTISFLSSSGTQTIDQSGTGLLKLTADLAFGNTSNKLLGLQGSTAGTGEFAGSISNPSAGTLTLTKSGTGTWTLSGNNSYTGITIISGGVLAVTSLANGGSNSSIGAATSAAANLKLGNATTLRYTGSGSSTDRLFTINNTVNNGDSTTLDASGTGAINFTNNGSLAYGTNNRALNLNLAGNSTADNTLAALIANNGTGVVSVTKNDSGKWILTNANTYTGATTITAGTLQVDGSLAAGSTVGIGTAGTLAGSGTINGNATLTGGGVINKSSGAIAGTLGVTGGNWNGNGSVTGAITSSSGTFTIGSGGNLTANGGLNVTGGSISAGNGTSTITGSVNYTSGSNSTYAGVIAGSGKTLTLNNASAVLTLSGVNTYTGNTTVSAGTLLVNGSTSSSSAVSVSSGAILGGNGTIYGAVTVNSGGLLAPGNSPGILTIDNNLTLASGSTITMQLDGAVAGTGYDRVTMTGSGSVFTLAGNNDLQLSLTFVPAPNTLFFLVDNQGSSLIGGTFAKLNGVVTDLSQGALFTVSGQQFKISYVADITGGGGSGSFTGGNDLAIQAVPEPATWALLAFSLTTVMVLRSRRNF